MSDAGGAGTLQAFVVAPGFEAALEWELGRQGRSGTPPRFPARRTPRWPAVITAPAGAPGSPPLDPAFALQQLPGAIQVRGDSVSALAEAADQAIGAPLEAAGLPFAVHVFVPDVKAYRSIAGRAALLENAWLDRLRARRRRLSKGHLPPAEVALGSEMMLVQLMLVGRSSLLCSAARPRPLPAGGFDVAPWPGGRAPVADDRQAPSRAYRKLREAFAWLGAQPAAGQQVVDLGGAPGGWAFTALRLGAAVTAVDRSPLAPPAAGHPRLRMVVGNAFTFRPAQPVDWLLCDVICQPARTIELCELWMREGWCRQLVATLKFKGEGDYGAVAEAGARLARQGWSFLRFKHLINHSNEVVILARQGPGRA